MFEKFKSWSLNKKLMVIIPPIAAVIAIVVTCLILFTGINDVVDQKEIKNWKRGEKTYTGQCPFKIFPVPVALLANLKAEKLAVKFWNTSLSKPVFVEDPRGIPVMRAPKIHYKFKGKCELVKLEDGGRMGQGFGHTFAWTNFRYDPGSHPRDWKTSVYICVEKYTHAIGLKITPVGKIAKQVGLLNYIKHEMGHVLIGPGHPKYADLMSKNQRLGRLHAHTRALIEETVIGPCSAGK